MIGRLRSRVTLEQRAVGSDGGGGGAETWQPVATLWADIVPHDVPERVQAEQTQGRRRYTITLRHRADITTDHRLTFQGVPLAIRSVVDVDNRQRWLRLHCEEKGGD